MARGRFITKEINVKVYEVPEEFRLLTHVSGIYFLIHKGEIDYIGRSVNIANRLTSHKVFDRTWHDEVWVYPIPREKAWTHHLVEDELIKHFSPPSNQSGLPKRK